VARSQGLRWTAKKAKLLLAHLGEREESAAPVITKVFKPGKQAADPQRGFFSVELEEGQRVVQYEPDPELRDTEQVPLLEEGGIDTFLAREVLPYAPEAWYDPGSVKTGYEVSFTRYFYKPKPLRTLQEIRADILALEKETEGLLGEIVGGAVR
jgi:type I restriction enzyme M protein